jgi:hypothetical protein
LEYQRGAHDAGGGLFALVLIFLLIVVISLLVSFFATFIHYALLFFLPKKGVM